MGSWASAANSRCMRILRLQFRAELFNILTIPFRKSIGDLASLGLRPCGFVHATLAKGLVWTNPCGVGLPPFQLGGTRSFQFC